MLCTTHGCEDTQHSTLRIKGERVFNGDQVVGRQGPVAAPTECCSDIYWACVCKSLGQVIPIKLLFCGRGYIKHKIHKYATRYQSGVKPGTQVSQVQMPRCTKITYNYNQNCLFPILAASSCLQSILKPAHRSL